MLIVIPGDTHTKKKSPIAQKIKVKVYKNSEILTEKPSNYMA